MLVIASIPWSSTFLSMMSTRSSRACHALARARISSSSDSAPTDRPKWSRRGHVIARRVVGDQEHELLDVVHLEHLALAVARSSSAGRRSRTRRRRSRRAACGAPRRASSGVRLIATWLKRGLRDANVGSGRLGLGGGHACSFSRPGERSSPWPRGPLVQAERGVEQPVERVVLLLDEQVVRQLARREQLERARRSRRGRTRTRR